MMAGRTHEQPPESWASSPAVRRNMQANRGRDTRPELAVRRLLHARGLRYRVNYRCAGLRRRTIDIAFPARRIACFIDGCFWHQCEEHFVQPKTNVGFWAQKLASNRERDRNTDAVLAADGWLVLRFWEHQSPESICDQITRAVSGRGRVSGTARTRRRGSPQASQPRCDLP
jgi:DNA mismatch endonuclease (patch repair protein)